jgi:tetratricopeptide (TPR) repeat protein
MGLDQQLSLALYRRDATRDVDLWGTQARIVADGIDKSGIGALLGEGIAANQLGFTEVTEVVMRSAVITSEGLSAIAGMLGAQTQVLAEIAHLLRAPLGTQARELYQRGARALNAGWTQEAVTELTASVEKDPYDPVAQFALGIAYGSADDNAAAAASMALVIRYSSDSPGFASLAAAAAILGSSAYLQVNQPDAARQLVAQVRPRVPDCAELELMAGRLSADADATSRAIQIAPEVAFDAVSLNLPGARDAAQRAVDCGPVDAMYRAHAAWTALGKPAMDLPDRADLPQAVMAHPRWLKAGAQEMAAEAAQLRRDLSDAQAALTSAHKISSASPTSATFPRVLARGVAWALTAVVLLAALGSGQEHAEIPEAALLALIWVPYFVSGPDLGKSNGRKQSFQRGVTARSTFSGLSATIERLTDQMPQVGALEAAVALARPARTRPLTTLPQR